jgi:hypothetical protein
MDELKFFLTDGENLRFSEFLLEEESWLSYKESWA